MGIRRVLVLIIGFLLIYLNVSYAREVPFTQEDRDRLIRLETKLEETQRALQKQIDDLKFTTQKQSENLQTLILWGFGILFGGMGILIGFVIWDRRTALAPAIRRYKELEEREERIEKALKELAKRDPKIEEVLKYVGLL